jgi:signal peptidase I
MPRRGSPIRGLLELIACTAISVSLLKGFLVEGFLISTGSMAPHLLGYHKRVVCPECGFEFARGTDVDGPANQPAVATCINCGRTGIDVSKVPRNEGDQLLVHKLPWLFSDVKRFEPMVFRRPGKATTAFVKRVVGLPGESIQIIDGNIYADDRLCRKTLAQQRGLCVTVYDDNFRPPGGQRRWTTGPGWSEHDNGFRFAAMDNSISWLTHHHLDIQQPGSVRDRYAYNPRQPRSRTRPVDEVLVTFELIAGDSPARFFIELLTTSHRVRWTRDSAARTQSLSVDGRTVKSVPLKTPQPGKRLVFEFSTIDQSLRAAVDGQLVLPPLALSKPVAPRQPEPDELLRLGAAAGDLEIHGLRIDRDVYYRGSHGQHGTTSPWQLGPDEFFMLGDNSPVSLDSRSWPNPGVPRRLVIGRPLLVHLPSRQWEVDLAGRRRHIRIPDVQRIRYIR